jgi:hypothetical protein
MWACGVPGVGSVLVGDAFVAVVLAAAGAVLVIFVGVCGGIPDKV